MTYISGKHQYNQTSPASEVISLESDSDLAEGSLIAIITSISVLICLTVAYLTYRCWLSYKLNAIKVITPEDGGFVPGTHLKISQSSPNIHENCKKENVLTSGLKKVFRQTTLPTDPARHLSFKRQLSHRLDFSCVEFSVKSIQHKEQPSLGGIKPELYQLSQDSDGGSSDVTSGRLYFSLLYDHQIELLYVKIIRMEDLPARDFSGTSDPYVKIYLLPDRKKKFQTKVHRKNLNPIFDETFIFNVQFSELSLRTLQFSIYDFDRFSRHDLIGQVVKKGLLENNDLSKENEYCMDIICSQQEKVDLGELMLSLCCLPTAGRLTVTVIKARNLKAMDITGSSDPYVKVSLMCQGKRIKKKKTSVKKSTLNPVYNEALVFDIPAENVEEASLIVKVIDYDRIGSDELMGCCAVGLQCMDLGRDHWAEMLDNPRKPIAQWYQLQEHVPGHGSSSNLRPTSSRQHSLGCMSLGR